jgi:hypothetical protein
MTMADPAQTILDLLIDHLMHDQRLPRMSWLAWSVKLRPLQQRIHDILDEIKNETRTDIRETVID